MRKEIKFMILPLVIIILAGLVSALTCTFDQTSTTAGTKTNYISGKAVNISVTISGHSATQSNITGGTLATGATGCTITGNLINNISALDVLDNTTYLNFTVNTEQMKDDTTCQFTVTAYHNGSGESAAVACTSSGGSYISDNTIPVLVTPDPSDGYTDADGELTFSLTCTNSSSANLYVGETKYSVGEASDVCTSRDTFHLDPGSYKWYMVVSDGLNSTTSSTYTVQIPSDASGGGVSQEFMDVIADEAALENAGVSEKASVVITKIKTTIQAESTPKELTKTGIGIVGGAAVGLIGGPFALITVPVGAIIGGIVGVII